MLSEDVEGELSRDLKKSIGRTHIWRHLTKLEAEGIVVKDYTWAGFVYALKERADE